jgi:hypothetical protein
MFILHFKDVLRRRYGRAIQYYRLMIDMVTEVANNAVKCSRQRLIDEDGKVAPQSFTQLASNPTTRTYFTSEADHMPSHNGTRPSAYLRARCPLCFGGDTYLCETGKYVPAPDLDFCIHSDIAIRPDIQISGDACFTQSREHDRNGVHDPPIGDSIPRTLCVTREECDAMKRYVEGMRNKKKPRVDHEEGVSVPNEILDLCEESFNAADERRVKSSKKRFDDTGIGAAVCRHDRIIWFTNMTEPGEQQYYMLVLLDKIFKELPERFTVGFLHDLACQFHRSMAKVCINSNCPCQ